MTERGGLFHMKKKPRRIPSSQFFCVGCVKYNDRPVCCFPMKKKIIKSSCLWINYYHICPPLSFSTVYLLTQSFFSPLCISHLLDFWSRIHLKKMEFSVDSLRNLCGCGRHKRDDALMTQQPLGFAAFVFLSFSVFFRVLFREPKKPLSESPATKSNHRRIIV